VADLALGSLGIKPGLSGVMSSGGGCPGNNTDVVAKASLSDSFVKAEYDDYTFEGLSAMK
jgi:hypothetical protein